MHLTRAEGKCRLPWPTGRNALFNAAQETTDFFFFLFFLLQHINSVSLVTHRAISAKLFSHWFIPSLSWHMGFFLFPGVGLKHFPLLKSWHSCLPIYPAYQGTSEMAAQVSGVSVILCSLVIICKVVEGVLCPIIQLINEVVKQYWTQYQWPEHNPSDWPAAGLCATAHNSLSFADSFQSISPSVYSVHTLCTCSWGCYGCQC